MSITNTRSARRSRRSATALAVGLAVLGFGTFATSASANFTINTGTLVLNNGSTSGTPPSSGSWVTLPSDHAGTVPFQNTTTTAASPSYTLINGFGAGLRFGATQPSGGIFGTLTTFNGTTFSARTSSAPDLTFAGGRTDLGTRTLVAGDLSGLTIAYGGGTYDVSTTSAAGGKHTVPLHGTISGNADLNTSVITLDWTSDLVEPGFSTYKAKFHWVGVYKP